MLLDFGTLLGIGLGLAVAALTLGRPETGADDLVMGHQDDWLRDRMQELGIQTWQELQQRSGLSRATLQRICMGEIARLQVGQLSRLAQVLEWPLTKLMQELTGEQLPTVLAMEASLEPQLEAAPPTPALDREIVLEQECLRLQAQLVQQQAIAWAEFRAETFEILQTLLTSVPSVKQMVFHKPDLPAKNLLALLTPVETLLQHWNYEPIGSAWATTAYDPQWHQGDRDDLQVGETVYVRSVGYRVGDQIIVPARVSRTLPGGWV